MPRKVEQRRLDLVAGPADCQGSLCELVGGRLELELAVSTRSGSGRGSGTGRIFLGMAQRSDMPVNTPDGSLVGLRAALGLGPPAGDRTTPTAG